MLDYAEITDPSELSRQGLVLDSGKYLRWKEDIKGSAVSIKTIHVKLKEIIPATNRPSNASGDYDCRISNRYGNEVSLNVGCPLVKSIEQTTSTLPNTGPGQSLVIGFVVASLSGYLWARSRILAKELDIIRSEYAASGGV